MAAIIAPVESEVKETAVSRGHKMPNAHARSTLMQPAPHRILYSTSRLPHWAGMTARAALAPECTGADSSASAVLRQTPKQRNSKQKTEIAAVLPT